MWLLRYRKQDKHPSTTRLSGLFFWDGLLFFERQGVFRKPLALCTVVVQEG